MKYQDAVKTVKKARNAYRGYVLPGREGRTRLVQRDNGVAIKYTNTDVVTIHPDDSVTLNTGGWYSKTTKDRFRYAESVNVFTESGAWYVIPNDSYVWYLFWGKPLTAKQRRELPKRVFEYKDHMTFNKSGTRCLNAKQLGVRSWTPEAWIKHIKSDRKARERRIARKAQVEREAKWAMERAQRDAANAKTAHVEELARKARAELAPIAGTFPYTWPTKLQGGKQ